MAQFTLRAAPLPPPTAARLAAPALRCLRCRPLQPARRHSSAGWGAALASRSRQQGSPVCRAAAGRVDAEVARKLLDGPCTVIDVRPAREYDDGHITKPPRKSASMPFAPGQDAAAFVAQVARKFPNPAAQLIVMCGDGGPASAEAAALLQAAGYVNAVQLEGGYAAYTQVWSPSGKRRPPSGRWVSTGKEALKSGLNIPGVADSYDEGGNLKQARYAEGLPPGQSLLD